MLEAKIAEAQRSQADAIDTSNMVPSSAGAESMGEAPALEEKDEAAQEEIFKLQLQNKDLLY